MSRRIFLLGYMTSGKSSLGKKLAKALQLKFYDLDHLIEEKSQESIASIFQLKGEEEFRKLEHQTLTEWIANHEDGLLALGGGTPCFFDNMARIQEAGFSIYLKVPEDLLIGRLRAKKAKRPLVKDLNDEEISALVNEQLALRAPYYEKANLIYEKMPFKAKELAALLNSN